ncbi:PilN domain-containing protein [Edaphobacter albus]|uniref:PilN domain-containing protein n=1 Tax=Edaphobacter sp. 4G125 TaxID=2763071 RepID=UPI0016470330|nr:PilN domain-containing protein [Edaphobacter sp. 4G125]QNI36206.1 PilN domain-containing protein [Edaphobacter sp. 4G125]
MRISVNLATRPFVELRPLYAKLRIAIVALVLLALVLGIALHSLSAKARANEAQMNALQSRTLQYQQERQRNEARMRQPQNMAVLERSQFLNALFAQKSFSWTAVMMDLERVLPAGVQVTSIEPTTNKSGEVNIRLRVSGERDRAVELVRNLEKSQRFITPRLAGEAAQMQEGRGSGAPSLTPGSVEFEIFSGYNPLPEPAEKKAQKASIEEAPKEQQSELPTPSKVSRRARGAKSAPPAQRPLMGVPR